MEENATGGNEERDPRLCTHEREDGTLCNGWRVKGEDVCAGHLGLGIAASPEAAAAAARQSAENRREKAQVAKKTAKQVYRDAVTDNAEEFVRIRLGIARDTSAPDGDRLRAMEQLENRALGRPTEHVEVENTTPKSVEELRSMSSEERRALLTRLESEGKLAQLRPTGTEGH